MVQAHTLRHQPRATTKTPPNELPPPHDVRMAPYGPLMAPYGSVWRLMAPYGSLWLLMAPYGPIWLFMAPHGSLWLLMAPDGPICSGCFSYVSHDVLMTICRPYLAMRHHISDDMADQNRLLRL